MINNMYQIWLDCHCYTHLPHESNKIIQSLIITNEEMRGIVVDFASIEGQPVLIIHNMHSYPLELQIHKLERCTLEIEGDSMICYRINKRISITEYFIEGEHSVEYLMDDPSIQDSDFDLIYSKPE